MRRTLAFAFLVLGSFVPACGGSGGGAGGASGTVPPPGPFEVGVAYLADGDVDGTIELYVADLEGDGFQRVSGPLVPGGSVWSFRWSPDRSKIAFLAAKDTVDVGELYVYDLGGNGPVRVSGPLVAGGNVTEYGWSPDSQRLAYRADQETDEAFALFVAKADGSGAVRVSGAMTLAQGVPAAILGLPASYWAWAPDGSRIAYVADQDADDVFELYTSRPDGAGNVKASGPLVAGGDVYIDVFAVRAPFAWAPDATAVAYVADQDVDERVELYRSAGDGSGNVRISEPMPADSDVASFAWAPDASRVAYVQMDQPPGVFLAHVDTVLPAGGGHVQVSQYSPALELAWAPDSSRLAYARMHGPSLSEHDVYTVSPDGTDHDFEAATVLYAPFGLGLDGQASWSASSQHLAIRHTNAYGSIYQSEALLTALGHGAANADAAPMPAGAAIGAFAWAPDSASIAYLGGQDTEGVEELYVSYPETGYGNHRVSLPLLYGRDVLSFAWTPDGSRLVYDADVDSFGEFSLFAVAPDGTGTVQVSGPLVFGGGVIAFELR